MQSAGDALFAFSDSLKYADWVVRSLEEVHVRVEDDGLEVQFTPVERHTVGAS